MTIQEGPDDWKEKAVKTRWPVEEGLIAGTTRQTGEKFLHPKEESLIPKKDRVLL